MVKAKVSAVNDEKDSKEDGEEMKLVMIKKREGEETLKSCIMRKGLVKRRIALISVSVNNI